MSITREFNLFLNAGAASPLVINVNQYDQGEVWNFTLYSEKGIQYTPSTGAIVGIKSDNLGIINTGTVVDGKVVITETQQMTAAPGKAIFELMIDDSTHGTANFIVLVEPKPGNNADLSESDLSLIQQAVDSTIPENIAEAVSDWMDDNLAPGEWVLDSSLSVSGAAADAKATGDAIADLQSAIQQGGSFTTEVKTLLESLFRKVAIWSDDDADATIDQLHDAMFPPTNLSYITAVYTQSGTVYDTDSLDSLKSDLVVTAHYDDSSTATVTTYTLSGTLAEGTSTVTVSYGGKTTTFTVNVTSIQSVAFEVGGIGTTGLDEVNSARARSEYLSISGSFTYNMASGSTDAVTIDDDVITAQIGGIDGSTGGVIEQSNRIITQFIRTGVQKLFTAQNDKGYYIKAFSYGASFNFLSSYSIGGLNTDSISGTVNSAVRYVRLVFKKSDNSDFTSEELASIKLTLNHFKAMSDMSINSSNSGYSFRVYDSSHNFLMLTGDQAINFIDESAYIANWLNADETDYYIVGLPANSEYVRAVARDVAGSDVSSVSGKIEIDNELYAITWEE